MPTFYVDETGFTGEHLLAASRLHLPLIGNKPDSPERLRHGALGPRRHHR
jgi:hypothetical protein